MIIDKITAADDELAAAMELLIPQLSRSTPPPSLQQVAEMLDQDSLTLFAYRQAAGEPIQGLLSLVTFTIPTGVRAWIEDVVIDDAARGAGAGRALVEAAVTAAAEMGARTVDLTSRPSREAANRLYQRCGFVLRDTNVYRFAAE